MHHGIRNGTRLALSGLLVAASVATGALLTSAPAVASPCGRDGAGSGSSGSLGSGSGSGSGPNMALGPQGPLPNFSGASTRTVQWLTGPVSPNSTFNRFGISGTDVGVSWDNGSGQTLMAFGDTFGDCSVSGQQWRHNVLLRSADTDLSDGMTVPDAVPGVTTSGSVVAAAAPKFSTQLISALGLDYVEVTTIPTAAISLPKAGGGIRQYINYMSVRKWGSTGHWDTNFSAIAYSDDNGQTWTTDQNTLLVNAPVTVPLPGALQNVEPNNGKFQQSAYFRGHGAQSDWVYQMGTPNGRFGAAFLARFKPGDILDLTKYQYWAGAGRGWVNSIGAVPDDGSAIVVPAPVSETSVAFSPYLGKYLMLNGDNGITMRTAATPEGPWSAPVTLIPPGTLVVYAPMIQPSSPAIAGNGKDLYFNASRWSDYNVMLLRSDLSKVPH